jgi:hypothetical protein
VSAESHAHDGDAGRAGRDDAHAPEVDVDDAAVGHAEAGADVSEAVSASECPLCGATVQASELRCPQCNMTLAGIDGRPGPFSRRALWAWVAALLVVYLVALVIVAIAPA